MLTARKIRTLLHYNKLTGSFVWAVTLSKRRPAGHYAGGPTENGYWRIAIGGRYYLAHRLAWFYVTGKWPSQIDHLNGIKTDNRFANLRDVDARTNMENMRLPTRRSITGIQGVSKKGNRYVARVVTNYKEIYCGCFKTVSAAHGAYLKAKRKLHPGCTI